MDSDLRDLTKKERQIRNSIKTVFQFTIDYKPELHKDELGIRLQLLEEAFSEFSAPEDRSDDGSDDGSDCGRK